MAITSLKQTKWLFNETFTSCAVEPDATINFKSNNVDYTRFDLMINPTNQSVFVIQYINDDTSVTAYSTSGWGNQAYRTITIVDGDDVENATLIAFLEANAVQLEYDLVEPEEPVEPETPVEPEAPEDKPLQFQETNTNLAIYENLSPNDYNKLTKEEHAFYLVNNAGVYKGENLIAYGKQQVSDLIKSSLPDTIKFASQTEDNEILFRNNDGELASKYTYFDPTTMTVDQKSMSMSTLIGLEQKVTTTSNTLSTKQDKLTAGSNITIENNTISAVGGFSFVNQYPALNEENFRKGQLFSDGNSLKYIHKQHLEEIPVYDRTYTCDRVQGYGATVVDNAIYFFGGCVLNETHKYLDEIWQVVPNTQDYRILTTFDRAISDMAVAAVGNNIYTFGGHNVGSNNINTSRLNSIYKYSIDTNRVNKLSATLPIINENMIAAAVGTNIFLFGGYYASNLIYKFDTTTETIEELSVVLPNAISDAHPVVIHESIYLFVGNTVYCFNTQDYTITSTTLSPAIIKAVYCNASLYGIDTVGNLYELDQTFSTFTLVDTLPFVPKDAAVINDEIYLWSINENQSPEASVIYRYNLRDKTVSYCIPVLPTVYADIAAALVGDRLYFCGGRSYGIHDIIYNTYIQYYDCKTNKFQSVSSFSSAYPDYDMSAVVHKNVIYFLGGLYRDYDGSSKPRPGLYKFNTTTEYDDHITRDADGNSLFANGLRNCCFAVADDYIYIFDSSEQETIQRYSITENRVETLGVKNYSPSVAVSVDKLIYLFADKRVLVFDTEQQKYIRDQELDITSSIQYAVKAEGNFYLFDSSRQLIGVMQEDFRLGEFEIIEYTLEKAVGSNAHIFPYNNLMLAIGAINSDQIQTLLYATYDYKTLG